MSNPWHSVAELPDRDGWIWVTAGNKGLGSKVKTMYFKVDDQKSHGKEKLREALVGRLNTVRYWMWAIPVEETTGE